MRDPDEFRPTDTQVLKAALQTSRPARETVGGSAGLGSAAVVLWFADLVGLRMDPVTAGVIGSAISTAISWAVRKKVMHGATITPQDTGR